MMHTEETQRLWELPSKRLAKLARLPELENWHLFVEYVQTQRQLLLEELAITQGEDARTWLQAEIFALKELVELPNQARTELLKMKPDDDDEPDIEEKHESGRRAKRRFGFRGV
jgi:hypothetical protein